MHCGGRAGASPKMSRQKCLSVFELWMRKLIFFFFFVNGIIIDNRKLQQYPELHSPVEAYCEMISIFVNPCVSQQTWTPKISTLFYAAEHVEVREGGGEWVRNRVEERTGCWSNLWQQTAGEELCPGWPLLVLQQVITHLLQHTHAHMHTHNKYKYCTVHMHTLKYTFRQRHTDMILYSYETRSFNGETEPDSACT